MNKIERRFKIINRGCDIIAIGCKGQGITQFGLTTMHKLGYCLLEEVVHILNPAIASRVAGVAVDSFYTYIMKNRHCLFLNLVPLSKINLLHEAFGRISFMYTIKTIQLFSFLMLQ